MKELDTYCDKIHGLILLADSGELTADQTSELERHLDQCPECQAYSSDVSTLMTTGRAALPDGIPSSSTVENILAKAGSERGTVVRFTSPWRFAVAAAAVAALVLGTYIALYIPGDETGNGTEGYGVGDVQIMVSLVSDGSVSNTEEDSRSSDEDKLHQLADTLLQLQGFKMEENETGSEDITDLLLPTALQSRNTPLSPEETSV